MYKHPIHCSVDQSDVNIEHTIQHTLHAGLIFRSAACEPYRQHVYLCYTSNNTHNHCLAYTCCMSRRHLHYLAVIRMRPFLNVNRYFRKCTLCIACCCCRFFQCNSCITGFYLLLICDSRNPLVQEYIRHLAVHEIKTVQFVLLRKDINRRAHAHTTSSISSHLII